MQPSPSTCKTSAKSGQLTITTQKKNDGASGSQIQGHEQLNKKISRARLGSKVLPNLVTHGGAELGQMAKFGKAWNDADCPDGPSLTVECMKGVEDSLSDLKCHLEVTITPCSYFTHDHPCIPPPVPKIRAELLILLGVEK